MRPFFALSFRPGTLTTKTRLRLCPFLLLEVFKSREYRYIGGETANRSHAKGETHALARDEKKGGDRPSEVAAPGGRPCRAERAHPIARYRQDIHGGRSRRSGVAGCLVRHRSWRVRRPNGRLRLGQDHAHEHARMSGSTHFGHVSTRGRRGGCDVRRPAQRLRNRKIGFVFQNFNLLARTTALENVELPMMYHGRLRGRQRRDRARRLLKKVGLESRLDHHPSQLSGGQQQRVAIARALANEPSILLADEPTGNIDSRTSREVMDLFRQLGEEDRITIILVTHDQHVARHACRTIALRDGRVVCDSTDFVNATAALQLPGESGP